MLKPELIDAIFAELDRGFIVHISEEFPNASYLDYFYSHTLKRSKNGKYDWEEYQTDNDASNLPVTRKYKWDATALRNRLEHVDERFLLDTSVEEVKNGPFRSHIAKGKDAKS